MRLLPMLLSLLASNWAWAEPVTYHFAPAPGSRFTLTVEKTGIWSGRRHVFEFGRYHATIVLDREAPGASRAEIAIEAASAVNTDTWVGEKDRKNIMAFLLKDMLDAEHHPRLVFRSQAVRRTGPGAYEASGVLNVRGLDKPVTVTATLDERSGNVAAVSGRAIVRLKDYGLRPPRAALGLIGTRDEMTVEFRLAPSGG